jgi:hypothetical protein
MGNTQNAVDRSSEGIEIVHNEDRFQELLSKVFFYGCEMTSEAS